MQLVQDIEVGMDVDGDAVPELDPSRIYYVGPSAGGQEGAILLAIEPSVRAGVLTAPGSGAELLRLAISRGGLGAPLQSRVPSLINSPGITSLGGLPVSSPFFDENMPLRNGVSFSVILEDGTGRVIQSPLIDTVAGAAEIQQMIEDAEWAFQSATRLRMRPTCVEAHSTECRRNR
jgi:hypothetical protein